MKKNIQGLTSSLNKLTQKKSRCNFEWKCNRLFCNLDHSFLYRKVNNNSARNRFPCVNCDSVFRKESQLEVHVKTEHVEEHLFKCESCSFKCKRVKKLQNHLRKKHQPSTNDKRNSKTNQSEEDIGIQENNEKVHKKVKVKDVKEKDVKEKGGRKRNSQKKLSNVKGDKDVPEILGNPKEKFEADVGRGEDSSECSNSSGSEIFSSSYFSEQSVLEEESGEDDSIQSGGMSVSQLSD